MRGFRQIARERNVAPLQKKSYDTRYICQTKYNSIFVAVSRTLCGQSESINPESHKQNNRNKSSQLPGYASGPATSGHAMVTVSEVSQLVPDHVIIGHGIAIVGLVGFSSTCSLKLLSFAGRIRFYHPVDIIVTKDLLTPSNKTHEDFVQRPLAYSGESTLIQPYCRWQLYPTRSISQAILGQSDQDGQYSRKPGSVREERWVYDNSSIASLKLIGSACSFLSRRDQVGTAWKAGTAYRLVPRQVSVPSASGS